MRAIQFLSLMLQMRKCFFVYIVTNKPWGTLYIGVTSNLEARIFQHKNGTVEGFTKRYGLHLLVYAEECANAHAAIHREKRLKKWSRTWKINLIRTDNPDWIDLAANWYPGGLLEDGSPGQAGR
ncbi:MAG TPA: GIY-YIG nuclease family protein [Rhizomicrobium sp.]|nr:GIY-YIG nuclease family protein [Rhizomicrobium sp.]